MRNVIETEKECDGHRGDQQGEENTRKYKRIE
jgi:hypothetical protein